MKKKQKMPSVRICLGKVVKDNRWKVMLHHLSKKMAQTRWVATRAFKKIVLCTVLNGKLEIINDKVLSSVNRTCLAICTDRKHHNFMQKTEVDKRWCDSFLELNQNRELIDNTGMCNTITYCSNEYMVCVKNYLVYGLRDQCVRLLKS